MKNVTMLPIDPRLIGVPVGAIPVPARLRRCLTAGAATASMDFVAVEDVGAAELASDLEIVSRVGVGWHEYVTKRIRDRAGSNTFDIEAGTRGGIAISVASLDHWPLYTWDSILLTLALARRTMEMCQSVQSNRRSHRGGQPPGALAGWTVLVLGYREQGRNAARICADLGMRVLVYRNAKLLRRQLLIAKVHTRVKDVASVLPEVDILAMHLLPWEIPRFLDHEMLSLMKPSAWLINTCQRGWSTPPDIGRYVILTSSGLTVLERAAPDHSWRTTVLPNDDILRLPEIGVEMPVSEFDQDFVLSRRLGSWPGRAIRRWVCGRTGRVWFFPDDGPAYAVGPPWSSEFLYRDQPDSAPSTHD